MKIAIVYHIYKNATYLQSSLQNIINQTDKNFELILVNDNASKNVLDVIKKINFSPLTNLKYYSFSQNLGHSSSFNIALKNTDADYVYYCGSNIELKPDFIATAKRVLQSHLGVDVLSFTKINNNGKITVYTKINNELKLLLLHSLKDKVFSTKLLREQNIKLNEANYYPLVFIYEVLVASKKWVVIDKKHANIYTNKYYTYNLYDLFDQNDYLISKYSDTRFWKNNLNLIECFMILNILDVFISRFFVTYNDKRARVKALNKAKEWLREKIPNWSENTVLNHKRVCMDPNQVEYIKNFKFKVRYVLQNLKKDADKRK